MHPRLPVLILPLLILPYTRRELPGWGKLLELFKVAGIEHYAQWDQAPTKMMRHKWSGYQLRLNLAQWSDRYTYFLGRYYELELQLLMTHVLRPGDRFVDIGANIGMISLHAAALVTETGQVESFEPNPEPRQRLLDAIAQNQLTQVKVHAMGLADQPGELQLHVIPGNTGMGTFAAPPEAERALFAQTYTVPIQVGDAVLANGARDTIVMGDAEHSLRPVPPVKLIKIDVEGFELKVLQGLSQTLATAQPLVITEVVSQWLARAGTTRTAIAEFMAQWGYRPYEMCLQRRFLQKDRIHLRAIAAEQIETVECCDFVWIPQTRLGDQLVQQLKF